MLLQQKTLALWNDTSWIWCAFARKPTDFTIPMPRGIAAMFSTHLGNLELSSGSNLMYHLDSHILIMLLFVQFVRAYTSCHSVKSKMLAETSALIHVIWEMSNIQLHHRWGNGKESTLEELRSTPLRWTSRPRISKEQGRDRIPICPLNVRSCCLKICHEATE
jgi:hypothetical protein